MKNPFNPTFGDVPKIFFDTDSRIDDLVSTIQNSDFARSFFITGVRGSGKTVFLNAAAHKFRKDPNCYQVNILNQENLISSLTKKLLAITETPLHKILDNVNAINLKGINIDLSDTNIEYDVLLEKILAKVKKQHKYVVIAINGNKRMQEVIKILAKDKVFVAQYRRRAIERRLIVPAGYGLVDYTLPYFDEYINQVQDPDSAYYLGY